MSSLIISDIDHTLLSNAGELLPENVQALAEARERGARVVLATARSFIGALPIHRMLGLETPLIVSNGTLVCSPDGRVLRSWDVPGEVSRAVFELFAETPHHWSVRLGTVAHLHPEFDRSRAPFDNRRFYRPLNAPPHEFFGTFEGVTSLSLFGHGVGKFYTAHPWSEMGLVPSFYIPSHYDPREAMSVISSRASKGEAARWVRDYLGLQDASVLAIGDSPADATMFPLGTGVAPACASPEALAAADWVGPSCDDGAVAGAIRRFVLEVVLEDGVSAALDSVSATVT